MAAESFPPPPYPIHESVKDALDKEYSDFYHEHLINRPLVHYQSVSDARKNGLPLGAGPPKTDLTTKDYSISRKETNGPDVPVRVFTPNGSPPAADGWPATVYFHGGGWVLGDINTENVVCSHICSRARCVVITVDYRLAPETPFPAAVEDSWEALLWTHSQAALLNTNPAKIIVGGSSAGGNLAIVMAQRVAARGGPKLLGQVLSVPVTDNTATTQSSKTYATYEYTPALPAEKMLWYRKHYLPNESDWADPEASPLLWKGDWSGLPPALVIVGELDVLREEGEQVAQKLEKAGVKTSTKVMKGMPHPFLAMDGVLQAGRDTITDICDFASESFK